MLDNIYGFLAKSRRWLYEKNILKPKKLPKPVVSVGNLSVGGTGKTPLTINIAKFLQTKGYKVCVLSRGYRRKSKGTLIVGDGKKIFCSWQEAGDEPYLMAKKGIPVVVSSSRYEAGIQALKRFEVDVFLLDDGFQHFQLYRDLNLLVVDAIRPFWQDRLLPFGRLREPIDTVRFADALILTKTAKVPLKDLLKKAKSFGKPVFTSKESFNKLTDFERDYPLEVLTGKEITVFSGLGNNEYFFKTVEDLSKKYNFKIKRFIPFKDHYSYEDFQISDEEIYLTTEKDLIKLPQKENLFALQYEISLDNQFYNFLLETVEKARKDKV